MEIYMDDLTPKFPYELGGDLKYIETIDKGSFGTVIHVLEISTKQDMAVKVINKNSAGISSINKMKEEISILRQLNHSNIVKFFGFLETNNQLLIKMEYIKYGTLGHWIKTHNKITEEEASIIINHILSAVIYLHNKQICHRDIKPKNIMFSKENDLHSIKIIDFGLSAQNFDMLVNNEYCGTYIYMAPEQIEKKLYFFSVDIWSIGILMFILLNDGKHPFYIKGDNRKDFIKKIVDGKINYYNKVSPMAKHLISKLLEPNSSWRYTGSQAIKHPWITRNKNDEPPLTFNELLTKSNNRKILKDLFNICLFMNYFSKKCKDKYFSINNEYIFYCNFYDEKIKEKINKKKEKCLDINSIEEDDNSSDDKLDKEKNYILRPGEKSYTLHLRNRKGPMFSSCKLIKSKISPSKIINSFNRKNSAQKVENTQFKGISSNKTIHMPNKPKTKTHLEVIRKFSHNNLVKSLSLVINKNKNNKNNKNKNIQYKSVDSENTAKEVYEEKNKSPKKENDNKNDNNNNNRDKDKNKKIDKTINSYKIFNYYSSKKVRNNLPNIIIPNKLNFLGRRQFSLNDSENYSIVPLVLPQLNKLHKNQSEGSKVFKIRKIIKGIKK